MEITMKDRKGWFFNDRSILTGLALAIGTMLAPVGSALAENCTPKPAEPALGADAEFQWGGAPISPEDRQKIDNLFSGYAWALDEREAARFDALFTGSYEVCTGGGNIRIYLAEKGTIPAVIQEQFNETKDIFRTRHIISNILLRNSEKEGGGIEFKATMLVLVQRTAGDRVLPEPDYSADLRGTLQVADGNWTFKPLTVYADTPVFEPMGR
jgi:hypothetical protein